jgi:uncharacterized membrane protein YgaE (UPF0421/DUF939 family)
MAAGLSVGIAQLLNFDGPIYALIAAVICTELSPSQTRALGLQRLFATVVGAVCGGTVSSMLPSSPWAIGLAILVAALICEALRMPDGAKVAGYVSGIVVLAHGAAPWPHASVRLIETALGIGGAILISYVPKLIRIDEPG